MKHFAWNDLRDIVTVQGRTWEHEDTLYFNWSSSGFTVRFRGSALLAEFSAQSSEEYDGIPGDPNTPHRTVWPWISVFVDDNDQPCRTFELTNKSTKYLIYSGTDEQEHTVRVVKLTENIKTGLSLHGFDVDGEILMPVVEPIKKRIEFVGDSITCGFGLGTSEKDRFYYPQEENVWMAHGPTAARYLGMDWQMICISGICLAPRKEIPMPVAMNKECEWDREQTANETVDEEDYLFRQPNGKPMCPSTFTYRFKLILKANNLPLDLSVHSLRHTNASLLISQGVDVRTVASLLGHAQASTTLDIYAHAFDKNKRKAQEKLGKAIGL